MGLTVEQRAIKITGLGASEVPMAAGLSPIKSPFDLWLSKASPTRPALVPDDEEDPSDEREVGDVLEPAILELYGRRTGFTRLVRPRHTFRHPEHEWALASPDAFVGHDGPLTGPDAPDTHLAEIKLVGDQFASHWHKGVPEYVVAQCQWQMFVLNCARCDVAALIGGTDLRIHTVIRSEKLIAALLELGRTFWFEHVLGNKPPATATTEEHLRYLARKYPKHIDAILPVPDEGAAFVRGLIDQYADADAEEKRFRAERSRIEAQLCGIIGDAAGIRGPWGQFTWKQQKGAVPYKAVATALAPGGAIPPALIEAHRGEPYRKTHFSPSKFFKNERRQS